LAAQLFFGLVYFLTEKGGSFSSPEQQSTKLHAAVSSGDYKELARLKRNNVSFDLKDSAGKTPLMVTQDLAMAKYLLENGANVNVVDQETDETPIFYAIRRGNVELMRLFIKHGADVQHVSKVPWEHTPIHTALETGLDQCVTILREHGAHDDRVDSITGKALTYAGGPQFEVIEKYHAAIQDQNIEELKNLTTSRQANFFETVDFNTWKYYYQPDMQLIEGYYNDSAATIKVQVITPDNYSVRWVYQLVRRGDDWKIARVWEVREP
jgi:ankyrin repeat protein